ncbi:AtMMH-1 [Halteromyces radiatus]|uniref:AtMMH-1 n=1 Tax=Halteromyces radiatus TaxID=101107 RepID=UPI002220542C|nr:AtMMH-1 [Halteromyces radiatus]KAI8089240.1 AtMMH-1 [Halteromyces radiatus]
MPEIAEVEHARRQCHKHCLSRKITSVETVPDELIFVNNTSDQFASILEGRTVVDTKRWGKYFILLFDQEPHLVAHFGMTGDIKFKHEKSKEEWPPRFWKTIITFGKAAGHQEGDEETIVMAFCDARRLGRLRLVFGDPLTSLPISKLGFDPLHNLPSIDDFFTMVIKRAVPVKALLLDQAFSAGVGNWIADEILYHSRLHPAQYSNSLTKKECETLREQMEEVCRIAVESEADESLLPANWLMTYRWNKGKGKGAGVLPNGHKLDFITVGGRTSAYAPSLQKLRGANPSKKTSSRKRSLKTEENEDDDTKDLKKTRKPRKTANDPTSTTGSSKIVKSTGNSIKVKRRSSTRLRGSSNS